MTLGSAKIFYHHAKTDQSELARPLVVQLLFSLMLKPNYRNLHGPG